MKAKKHIISVLTPDDDPVGYALDWRYRTAEQWIDNSTNGLPANEVVKGWVKFLRCSERLPPQELKRLTRVRGWNQSTMGGLLKSLLLTNASYETIAERLGVEPGDVQLFEASFFNVRLESGELRPSLILNARLHADNPESSAAIRAALQAGDAGVCAFYGIAGSSGTHDVMKSIQSIAGQQLMRRLVNNQVDTKDLVRIHQIGAMRQELVGESEELQGLQAFADFVLKATMPKLMPPSTPAGSLEKMKADSDRMRKSQANIAAFGDKESPKSPKGKTRAAPFDERRQTEQFKRDMQDMMIRGADGNPVPALAAV